MLTTPLQVQVLRVPRAVIPLVNRAFASISVLFMVSTSTLSRPLRSDAARPVRTDALQ